LIRTAPRAKIAEKMMSVGLRPILAEMGAEPSAPKNAPPWRTETTLEETLVTAAASFLPFL
jgi:hypothetical protein